MSCPRLLGVALALLLAPLAAQAGECGRLAPGPLDRSFFDYRNRCEQPLAEKVAGLRELIDAEIAAGQKFTRTLTLGIGRLVHYREAGRDLALAAARSADWDTVKGRSAGSEKSFVATLLLHSRSLQSFGGAFPGAPWRLSKVEVEKVLIGPPGATPFAGWLLAQGVRKDAKVPYDVIVWLTFAAK
jgi:hypothetical protein